MGIYEKRNCKFCTDEIDYTEHFFWSCSKNNLIWKKVKEYANLKFDKLTKLKLKDVLFGYNETENSSDVPAINHVTLKAKICISKYRYGKYFNLFFLFERELSLRNA